MKNRKELEQEYRELVERYYEKHQKYMESLLQFASVGDLKPGKEIESPKRMLDTASYKEITEAEQKLDKLRQEMVEARNRLYEDYH